ncbi:Protein of unknown function [Pyronema omphalodes CBS 100304]|uniref:Uncharacterized protein n=1 Tax=Pyronema omphalodes (strain CBS 100304) TaxID=1076935 RepID=U4LPY7_PYROM|nr:Protein of unknown function [Pyronema omphalodes CBS 100304]
MDRRNINEERESILEALRFNVGLGGTYTDPVTAGVGPIPPRHSQAPPLPPPTWKIPQVNLRHNETPRTSTSQIPPMNLQHQEAPRTTIHDSIFEYKQSFLSFLNNSYRLQLESYNLLLQHQASQTTPLENQPYLAKSIDNLYRNLYRTQLEIIHYEKTHFLNQYKGQYQSPPTTQARPGRYPWNSAPYPQYQAQYQGPPTTQFRTPVHRYGVYQTRPAYVGYNPGNPFNISVNYNYPNNVRPFNQQSSATYFSSNSGLGRGGYFGAVGESSSSGSSPLYQNNARPTTQGTVGYNPGNTFNLSTRYNVPPVNQYSSATDSSSKSGLGRGGYFGAVGESSSSGSSPLHLNDARPTTQGTVGYSSYPFDSSIDSLPPASQQIPDTESASESDLEEDAYSEGSRCESCDEPFHLLQDKAPRARPWPIIQDPEELARLPVPSFFRDRVDASGKPYTNNNRPNNFPPVNQQSSGTEFSSKRGSEPYRSSEACLSSSTENCQCPVCCDIDEESKENYPETENELDAVWPAVSVAGADSEDYDGSDWEDESDDESDDSSTWSGVSGYYLSGSSERETDSRGSDESSYSNYSKEMRRIKAATDFGKKVIEPCLSKIIRKGLNRRVPRFIENRLDRHGIMTMVHDAIRDILANKVGNAIAMMKDELSECLEGKEYWLFVVKCGIKAFIEKCLTQGAPERLKVYVDELIRDTDVVEQGIEEVMDEHSNWEYGVPFVYGGF